LSDISRESARPSSRRRRYTLGNVLWVEMVDAPEHVGRWLQSEAGLRVAMEDGPSDLTIRFVQSLGTTPYQRLDVNGNTFGFDERDFFLVDRSGARARLNFDQLAKGLELTCEHKWRFDESVFRAMLAALALTRGWLLLHGSAFEYDGVGVLVTGWQSSGKSEFLLGMRGQGRYISDEPTLVHAATGQLVPSPALLPLWDWQIKQLGCEGDLDPAHRTRVRMMRVLDHLLPSLHGDSIPARGVASVRRRLKAITRVPVPPQRIFQIVGEHERITVGVVITGSIGQTAIRSMSGETLAKKMAVSQLTERGPLVERYNQFLHAFPERRSELVDRASERELALLGELFKDRIVLDIVHPYPGTLAEHGALARQAIRAALTPAVARVNASVARHERADGSAVRDLSR
jgi:hypothetical protein